MDAPDRRPEALTVNYESGEILVRLADGTENRERSEAAAGSSEFRSSTIYPQAGLLELVAVGGDKLMVELAGDGPADGPRANRTVIYLDQNMWRQIVDALNTPEAVRDGELEPTLDLIGLAKQGRVLLPLSAGHMMETGPLYGERRVAVATQMISLSRGWVMTHPLIVRFVELLALFQEVPAATPELNICRFGLDYRLFFSEPQQSVDWDTPDETARRLIDSVSGIQAIMAVLLEDEAEQSIAGQESTQNWATEMSSFAVRLASERVPKEHRRAWTLDVVLGDLAHDVNKVAVLKSISVDDFDEWRRLRADDELARMPAVGRYREILHHRLLDPKRRWLTSDLIDLVFLCSAAGYADHVVCEKRTGNDLRRLVDRVPPGAEIHTGISGLLSTLAVS